MRPERRKRTSGNCENSVSLKPGSGMVRRSFANLPPERVPQTGSGHMEIEQAS